MPVSTNRFLWIFLLWVLAGSENWQLKTLVKLDNPTFASCLPSFRIVSSDEDQNRGDFNKRYLDLSDIVLDQPLQDGEGQRLGNK